MGTIAEKLIYVNGTKSAIKTAIEAKGVTVGNATFREYATKIGEITTSSGETSGWQPDPLWTDIRDMYDNDTLRKQTASGTTFYSDSGLTTSVGTLASSHGVTSVTATYGKIVGDGTDGTRGTTYYVAIADVTGTYIYSAVYLISASDLTTAFKSGARYITSDGYDSTTELAVDYTHTWDLEDDIIDSTGAYTRWIKVYRTTALNIPYNFNNTVLWCIYNLGTSIVGSTTTNANNYFSYCKLLQSVTLKENITAINDYSFRYTYALKNLELPTNLLTFGNACFFGAGNFELIMPNSVVSIGTQLCQSSNISKISLSNLIKTIGYNLNFSNYLLNEIYLPNSITSFGIQIFQDCTQVLIVVLETGFNCDGLDIHYCEKISVRVVVAMFEALFDRTSLTAYTITIPSKFNTRLTTTQKAIASDKNWTIAYA